MKAWLFLILAIIFEVGGVSFMKAFDEPLLKYGIMGSMLAISYYFMALAIVKIPVAIAYAIWEVVGLSLVVLVSLIIFKESLTLWQVFALLLAGVGIILINLGEEHEEHKKAEK